MAKSRITINKDAVRRAIQPQLDEIQEELTETMRGVIRQVRNEMTGHSSAEVYPVLVSRLEAEIPGVQVNHETMRRLADEIEAGTLTG